MKKLLALVGVMTLAIGLSGCGPTTPDSNEPVKVGVSIPLSGDAASIGTAFQNGINLALVEMTEDMRNKVELVYEDDQLEPAKSVAALNKMIDLDGIDVFVTLSSSVGNAIAPIAEQRQIPTIGYISDPKVVDGRNWVVKFGATPEEENKAAVAEILKRGYKKVAEISSIQDYALLVRDLFNESTAGQIEVVVDEEYNSDDKDFQVYIAKLREIPDVDAVFVNLLPGQAGLFAKKLREANIDLPLFSYEFFEDANEVAMSDGALVGQWYVSGDESAPSFMEAYKQTYPGISTWPAGEAHDIMMLVATAIDKYGNDRTKINEYLHTVENFEGVLGTFSASGRNDYNLPAAVKVVTEDGFEKLYK